MGAETGHIRPLCTKLAITRCLILAARCLPTVSNDLAGDARWPRFGPAAVERLGIRSSVAYRLYIAPGGRAALVLHSDWPHAYQESTIATGSIFAAYCSLTVLTTSLLRERRVSVRRATDVHREIGVAAGLLMTQKGLRIEAAYRQLVVAGRSLRRTLPEIAEDVLRRGLPDAPDDPAS